MKLKLLLLFFLPAFVATIAQNFSYQFSFGEFEEASSFYIASNGNIYVTDEFTDEIFSMDTLGTLLKTTGGYGWEEDAFDDPVDVHANPLSVYVADKNNHRIQRFDSNLNFLSQLFTRESENIDAQFGYPLGCSTSNLGDLYILDSENARVVKFDLFGNFVQNFGSYDAGVYQLSQPTSLAISPSNNIFVTDGIRIVIFDNYGSGIGEISGESEFSNIRILFNNLTVISGSDIFYANLKAKDLKLSKISMHDCEIEFEIVSAIVFNNKLYVLSPSQIHVFEVLN